MSSSTCRLLKTLSAFVPWLKVFWWQIYNNRGAALSGLVCAYRSATSGSNPKHTIYASFIYSQICACIVKKNENKQKIIIIEITT